MRGLRFRPGACVVLEGPDGAGKTTQRRALEAASWAEPRPKFAHMPTGGTRLGEVVYDVTEHGRIESPLGRQLLHLAAHAEALPHLRAMRAASGLVLDRWWWSTVAYGWFGDGLRNTVSEENFFGAIDMVWRAFGADLVLVFGARETDGAEGVLDGYDWLRARHDGRVLDVPAALDVDEATRFIFEQLRHAGVVAA